MICTNCGSPEVYPRQQGSDTLVCNGCDAEYHQCAYHPDRDAHIRDNSRWLCDECVGEIIGAYEAGE